MLKFFSLLSPLAIALVFTSCTTRSTKENEIAHSLTDSSSTVLMDSSTSLSGNFKGFFSNFPEKVLPARFPTTAHYDEGDLKAIAPDEVKEFLSQDIFDHGMDKLYYLSSLKIHPNLFSVVILQLGYMGSSYYLLVNYTAEGEILSSKNLAHYSDAGGIISYSSAVIENERVNITYTEKGKTSDSIDESHYAYSIKPNGAILPNGIPSALITEFYSSVLKNDEYLLAPHYGTSKDEVISEAFKFYKSGDFVVFSPNFYSFTIDAPDDYNLIVNSFTETPHGYQFTLKDEGYPHEQYDRLTHLTLNTINNKPGIYALLFTQASSNYAVITESKNEYVISKANLSSYKTRKLPFIKAEYTLVSEGMIQEFTLGSPDHFVKEFAKKHEFILKEVKEKQDGETVTYYRLYDNNQQLQLETIINTHRNEVAFISLYNPLYKTSNGIGVGSTLGELLYAHENVSATCGEAITIISIPGYQHARFIINYVAGAPDTEVDSRSLDKTLKINRIDFHQ